jgi:acyl carrier protein
MPSSTFEGVVTVLTTKFHVEPQKIEPQAPLQALGLDSLSLMEFVFAIEDHFNLRIPDERLDPRQAELTLADVCVAIDEAIQTASQAHSVPGSVPAGP